MNCCFTILCLSLSDLFLNFFLLLYHNPEGIGFKIKQYNAGSGTCCLLVDSGDGSEVHFKIRFYHVGGPTGIEVYQSYELALVKKKTYELAGC